MKKIKLFTFLLFTLFNLSAQNEIEELVKEGVQLHDKGEFDKAIDIYKKALKINPKSPLVNYEMAMTYFSNGDYPKSVEYSDKVLDQKDKYLLQAYLTKGSALDVMGKTKKSIKVFERAIKETEGHYLLFYNLALNYYKIKQLEKAEENVLNAIQMNSNHASSHYMLADIHNQLNNPVQSLLAAHFFLFLEPNSQRSLVAYQIIQKNFGKNVSKDDKKPNTINITLSPSPDEQFGAAELMLSMLEASKNLEENEGKSDDEMFIENTESFFKILGELKKDSNEDIWWNFYTPLFYDIAKSKHLETYCKYISQSGNENSQKWLDENNEKLNEFDSWLKN